MSRSVFACAALACLVGSGPACLAQPAVTLFADPDAGILRVEIDRAEAFSYRHDGQYALPHVWPLRSPGGGSMLVQHPDPFPHHRSLWIADRVQIDGGPDVDFYHCWKNLRDAERPEQGFRSFIRHTGFESMKASGREAEFVASLEWVIDESTVALRERRSFHVTALGDGEYLLDLEWALTAASGDVTFTSDWVHYAWPYVRMDPAWSGDRGGVIEDDRGRRGQAATNEQHASWVDYSSTVDGERAGIAVMVPPGDAPPKWVTREYGTFGPRRVDALSGTRFTLEQGRTLEGRAAVLVHRGDAAGGRVAERYAQWLEGIDDGD
jgi:hypothetical protein